jgi:catechol 2,3-dioxygenase-like lactoylglutathione lyase family enzyme
VSARTPRNGGNLDTTGDGDDFEFSPSFVNIREFALRKWSDKWSIEQQRPKPYSPYGAQKLRTPNFPLLIGSKYSARSHRRPRGHRAEAVALLVSDRVKFITGGNYRVDGRNDGFLTNVQKARGLDVKVQLGAVWHFSLAVIDPEKSAEFWTKNFDLQEMFRSDEAIALTNDAIIIGFFKGTPHPEAIDHLSFHLDSMRSLREALATLKKNGVELEDPGDEIGPTAPGSPHMGLWFHDPDGYRWELSVQNGARER